MLPLCRPTCFRTELVIPYGVKARITRTHQRNTELSVNKSGYFQKLAKGVVFTISRTFISITLAYEYQEMEMQFNEIVVILRRCAVIVVPPMCVVRLCKYVQSLAACLLLRTPQSALTRKRLKTRVQLSQCPRLFCSSPVCVCFASVRTVLMAYGHGTKKLTPGQFIIVLSLPTVQVQNCNSAYSGAKCGCSIQWRGFACTSHQPLRDQFL